MHRTSFVPHHFASDRPVQLYTIPVSVGQWNVGGRSNRRLMNLSQSPLQRGVPEPSVGTRDVTGI